MSTALSLTFWYCKCRWPLWSQYIQTNTPIAVDIWVVNFCCECNLWQSVKRMLWWSSEVNEGEVSWNVWCVMRKVHSLWVVWRGNLSGSEWWGKTLRSGKGCRSIEKDKKGVKLVEKVISCVIFEPVFIKSIALTGPIIVACQWNTGEKMYKGFTYGWNILTHTHTIHFCCSLKQLMHKYKQVITLDKLMQQFPQYLQSSPTGPAEHWAGGSFCRSDSSCGQDNHITNEPCMHYSVVEALKQLSSQQKKKKLCT